MSPLHHLTVTTALSTTGVVRPFSAPRKMGNKGPMVVTPVPSIGTMTTGSHPPSFNGSVTTPHSPLVPLRPPPLGPNIVTHVTTFDRAEHGERKMGTRNDGP